MLLQSNGPALAVSAFYHWSVLQTAARYSAAPWRSREGQSTQQGGRYAENGAACDRPACNLPAFGRRGIFVNITAAIGRRSRVFASVATIALMAAAVAFRYAIPPRFSVAFV